MKLRRPGTKDFVNFFILSVVVQAFVIIISKLQGAWVPDGRILIGIYIFIIPIVWDTAVGVAEDMNIWEEDK